MASGTLTAILSNFAGLFNAGIGNVVPYAKGLIGTLAVIDLAKTFLFDFYENDPFKILVRKIFLYGVFFWFLNEYKYLVDTWLDGCVFIGLAAGGNTLSATTLTDPSYIIDKGLEVAWPIMQSAKGQTIVNLDIVKALSMVICYILIVFSYVVIAIQIFITYLEFYIVGALASIFLPFGVFEKTANMAEKAFGAIINIGTKLMVLAFVLGAVMPSLVNMTLPANADQNDSFTLMGTAAAIAFLCWQAPGLASALLSGHPQLHAGSAMGTAALATSIAYAMKGGAGMALSGAMMIPGVKPGLSAVRSAAGGALSSAYSGMRSALTGGGGTSSSSAAAADTSSASPSEDTSSKEKET